MLFVKRAESLDVLSFTLFDFLKNCSLLFSLGRTKWRDTHIQIIFLTSMLSLGIGASVGPEAAMGNIGGAIGTFLGQKKNFSDRRRAIAAFAGMAGAMGALFPSPILSVLLLHELSITSRPGDSRFNAAVTAPLASFVQGQEVNAQHDFMEQVCLAGIASSTAFAIFFGLAHKTFLDPSKLKFAVYDIGDYNVWHLAAAIPMGIASGIIGVITLVLVGLFRKIKYRISIRLRNRGIPMRIIKIIIPTLGGLLFGLIAVAFPLTLGDGASQLPKVVQHSYATETTIHLPNGTDVTKHIEATLTPSILIGTLFAKILAMAISLSFGMVGGNIFPCIFAGTCAGCSITLVYPTLPITLTVPCMMAAVPSAFAPIPFSLVGIVILSFVIDGQMTAPVFIATFMSYLTNCGFGVIQGILEQQNGLQGTMTNLRNNNNHSHYHNSNSKTNSPIDSFSYGLLGTGGNEIKGMNSSALKDVSEIIFAKGGSYIDDDN